MLKKPFSFNNKRYKDSFGGSLLKNSNAKIARPLSTKYPMHLVLRSTKARGRFSFLNLKQFRKVNKLVKEIAQKYEVKIYDYANVGNHLHILIRLTSLEKWRAFIRELTGRLAQQVQNLAPNQKSDPFWDLRPFTRIVKGWRAFEIARAYIYQNRVEAEGLRPQKQNLSTA